MPNKSYRKGYRLERKLVNQARNIGLISGRMASRHSPFDIYIIDKNKKIIKFIQCKNFKISWKQKKELEKLKEMSGSYNVVFDYVSN